ncbi:MAG: AarF/ABC1/UbiB kinase family protein [Leptospira sp.]|nr:AarF/ABC1/UbiB kinase family protein [Leptospira sp.]
MIRTLSAYIFFVKLGIKLFIYFKWTRAKLSQQEESERTSQIWSLVGQRCYTKFLKLGGIYIKLGQFLANAAHLFPDEFISPLTGLQDQVPPKEYPVISKRFRSEMNMEPEEIFDTFEKIPIASASTAQVHRAVYKSKQVAVKILYPGIESSVRKDMKIIFHVLKLIHKFIFPFPYADIHRQMDQLFLQEMDMNLERANLKKMAWFLKDEPKIFVPRVIGNFESRGILVTEFIEGKKFSQVQPVTSKREGLSIHIELLIRAYMLMVFRFRFFHADPHPGNMIVTEQNHLYFLDFGAVGWVNENEEKSLIRIFKAAMDHDSKGILDGLESMGVLTESIDKEEILRLIEYSLDRVKNIVGTIENFRNINISELDIESDIQFIKSMRTGLKDLVRALQPPDNYIALQRTVDLLIGNVALIDPYHSVFDYAEKPFRSLILKERFFPWIWSLF